MKHGSSGSRHDVQKYIQNACAGGLRDGCYDEELFKSGSWNEEEAKRVFPNKNVAKLLHVFLRDESLVHFSLGAPTNNSSGCLAFLTLAARVLWASFTSVTNVFTPSYQTRTVCVACFAHQPLRCRSNQPGVCLLFGSIQLFISASSWNGAKTSREDGTLNKLKLNN